MVAIPEEEAEVISAKVNQIKKQKKPSNPKHDADDPPALDPGIEATIKLNILLNDVQKGSSKIIIRNEVKTFKRIFQTYLMSWSI